MAVRKPTDKQLYKMKNCVLQEHGKQVTPFEFYRDVFPEGSLGVSGAPEIQRPNMIYTMIEKSETGAPHAFNRLVFDDLKEITRTEGAEFAVASPVAYRGKNRTAANAHHLWGFCIDLDGVKMDQIRDLLFQIKNDVLPEPTYIVNSGHGLHVYYLLEEPVPLYKHLHRPLDELKKGLTKIVWNRYTSEIDPEKRQFQGIFQGFRMPGTQSKLGKRYPVVAFRYGHKTSIDVLNRYVEDQFRVLDLEQQRLPLEQAKELYPEWYERRIVRQEKVRNKWDIAGKVHGDNPHALYDWWLSKIRAGAFDGNRYNCIAVLMTYAVKCDVDKEKVLNDALDLVPWLNSLTETPDNDFTVQDVYDAYTYYSDSYATYSIRAIEAKTKISIERNKRNGRKQELHLRMARSNRDILCEERGKRDWREGAGRPHGSGTAAQRVAAYRAKHPGSTVTVVARELNLSRTTVYKWWKNDSTQLNSTVEQPFNRDSTKD